MNRTVTTKMEFGRHETFAIRHGWLGKGLERLSSESLTQKFLALSSAT